MSLEEYHILITKNEEYMEINAQMRRELDEIRKKHAGGGGRVSDREMEETAQEEPCINAFDHSLPPVLECKGNFTVVQ